MKITTKATYSIETGELLEWEGFEYDGPLELAGGGPSAEQRAAAARQEEQTRQDMATQRDMLNIYKSQYAKIDPFETSILKNGLPFMRTITDYANGSTARAALPARAQLLRSIGGNDASMPNGFKAGVMADFENGLARSYDDNIAQALMADFNARQSAASALTGQQQLANPLGWSGAVTQGNNAVMQAPLQSPDRFAPIMGAVGGALSNKAMKF